MKVVLNISFVFVFALVEVLAVKCKEGVMDRVIFTAYMLSITFLFVVSTHVNDVEGEMKRLFQKKIYQNYYKENVINVTSWNINTFHSRDICKYMKKVKSTVRHFIYFISIMLS